MDNKCLLYELNKLKESSFEAVENAFSFNSFKEYMHVKRPVEDKLFEIICEADKSERAQLILVCGGVGDGKSHVLSYLLQHFPWIKQNFEVHNDATESYLPNKTSIDTLNNVLADFADVNLQNEKSTKKIILAINLGTLNNFIESNYGESYRLLKNYIKSSKLLEIDKIFTTIDASYFHSISFSDYNLFLITEDGISSNYLSDMINKVVNNDSSNPFYHTYNECCCNTCTNSDNCPIKLNYELLFDKKIRVRIANFLAECIIKYRLILTSRAILNFVYDIVSGGLDDSVYKKSLSKWLGSVTPTDFSKYIIPNFMFEHAERSTILHELSKLDPLELRTEFFDDLDIELNTSKKRRYIFKKYIDCPKFENLISKLDEKGEVSALQKLFYRLFFLYREESSSCFNKTFTDYLSYLYHYNKCDKQKLLPLYKLVKDSIYKYGGINEAGKINVFMNNSQIQYRISQSIDIKAEMSELCPVDDSNKFFTAMKLSFTVDNSKELKTIIIDYNLFKLLNIISKGYKLNKKDRDDFISFVSFAKSISETESLSKTIFIEDNCTSSKSVFKFSVDELGTFEFSRR